MLSAKQYAVDARWKADGATICTTTPNPDYNPEAEAGEDNLEFLPYTGSSYTFTMLKATEVSALAELGRYDLSVSTGNGSVTIAYGEHTDTVTSADGSKILPDMPGATAIALTAQPDYGYHIRCQHLICKDAKRNNSFDPHQWQYGQFWHWSDFSIRH